MPAMVLSNASSLIVVGSDSMDLQYDKSNIDNEEMLQMV
jgi:hypothetical protein